MRLQRKPTAGYRLMSKHGFHRMDLSNADEVTASLLDAYAKSIDARDVKLRSVHLDPYYPYIVVECKASNLLTPRLIHDEWRYRNGFQPLAVT